MFTPSNLYVEKIFAESPIGLWPFDDTADYISYVSESNRNFYDNAQWIMSTTGGGTSTKVQYTINPSDIEEDFPFPNSAVTRITTSVNPNQTITLDSVFTIDSIEDTLSVGFYLYSETIISNFSISLLDGSTVIDTVAISNIYKNKQNQILATFHDLSDTTALKIRISFDYFEASKKIYLNGLTSGSFNEEFSGSSFGYNLSLISELSPTIALDSPNTINCITASEYATKFNYGYYIIDDEKLLAKNSGIPLVYGASNSTIIQANESILPALIVPGLGFLNENGRSSVYTFECWLRLTGNSSINGRLIGPITSDDGLYLESGHLVLSIAGNTCSYFIGEMFRPILLDIIVTTNSASIMINGEIVASMQINRYSFTLASPQDQYGRDQDWIGIYGNISGLRFIELDCVAIYSYAVTTIMAKKRFAYGQAVKYPESINTAFSGESILIDYQSASYSKSYNYPETANWLQGTSDNLAIQPQKISSPQYSLPKLVSTNSSLTIAQLEKDIEVINNDNNHNTINLKIVGTDWENADSYFYYDSLNILNTRITGICGVFDGGISNDKQLLFKIIDKTTSDYMEVTYRSVVESGNTNTYIGITVNNSENGVLSYDPIMLTSDSGKFYVSINIDTLVNDTDYMGHFNFKTFFANMNNLELYILGEPQTINTMPSFDGTMDMFGFATSFDANVVDQHFENPQPVFTNSFTSNLISDGVIVLDQLEKVSYKLHTTKVAGNQKLEIGTTSYWQTHIPLSYFSDKQYDSSGELRNTLDFMQIDLDVQIMKDLATNLIDTENNNIKVYVGFQPLIDGANKPFYELPLSESNKTLIIEDAVTWEAGNIFEITNKAIVYPPYSNFRNDDFAICFYVEIMAPTSLTKPTYMKYIQVSSRNLSDNSSSLENPINAIGTKFGKQMYPYLTTSLSPNTTSYKEVNPFTTFNTSAPHLYLTNDSGICVVDNEATPIKLAENRYRGLFFRLNPNQAVMHNLSSFQMSVLWNDKPFPTLQEELFRISSDNGDTVFYIQDIGNNRGQITVTTPDSTTFANLYLNGKPTSLPIIYFNQWSVLGAEFSPYIKNNSSTGHFFINNKVVVNNISTYQLDPVLDGSQITYSSWQDFIDNGPTWNDYYDPTTPVINPATQQPYVWKDILYQSVKTIQPINPAEVYKFYIGTNKIILDSLEQFGQPSKASYEYVVYNNIQRTIYDVTSA